MPGLNVSQIQGKASEMGIGLSNEEADSILGQAWDQSQFGADVGKVQSILQSRIGSSGGGGGGSSQSNNYSAVSSSTPQNFQDIVKQSLEMNKRANAPVVASMQGSLPEISQKFEQQKKQTSAEIEPLKERYKSLLQSVTSKGKTSEEAQTRITSGELGKRGIVGSSTLAQQEIQNAVEPIRENVRGLTTEIGLGQEEGLRGIQNLISGLTTSEVEQKRAVQNAIAQLEAGGNQTAIQNALAILQNQQSQSGQQASLDLQKQQQALAQKVYENINLPESQANIANVNSTIANRSKESSFPDALTLLSQFGIGQATPAKTGFSNVDALLAQGKFDEARQLLANP